MVAGNGQLIECCEPLIGVLLNTIAEKHRFSEFHLGIFDAFFRSGSIKFNRFRLILIYETAASVCFREAIGCKRPACFDTALVVFDRTIFILIRKLSQSIDVAQDLHSSCVTPFCIGFQSL
ncbi:hypothetical protein GV67_18420 [Pseudorhizobium pelagicum]|nr:hypothetical protein GV67_18420 [Pseudorhizobium pelagicum]